MNQRFWGCKITTALPDQLTPHGHIVEMGNEADLFRHTSNGSRGPNQREGAGKKNGGKGAGDDN
jgi:hypothetical protein